MMKKNYYEFIVCPVCGSREYKIRYPELTKDAIADAVYSSSSDSKLFEQVVACSTCSLLYINPRLSHKEIMNGYESAVDNKFISQNNFRIKTFILCLKQLKQFLNLNKGDKVLDVGCAGGAFLMAAKEMGYDAYGVEPSNYLSSYARVDLGLNVESGVLDDKVFPNQFFDFITMWDVIEHLPNPKNELSIIRSKLTKNGYLVVNFPDIGSIWAKVMKRKWPFMLSVHLLYFNKKTIKSLLQKTGFEVVRFDNHWQILELGYVLERAEIEFKIFKYIKAFIEFIRLSKLPICYWIGQTRVIARKI